LLAVFIGKKGHSVELLERRPDLRREKISAGRSINLAISTRGLHALSLVGLEEEVLRISIPMKGRMVHAVDGSTTLQPYGRDDSECIHSVSRSELNRILLTAAEATGKVRTEFHRKAVGYDF